MQIKNGTEPAVLRVARKENIIKNIKDLFDSFGYIKLDFPLYERYDILKETCFDISDETTIRYTDRASGKSFVLRPDFTPQVCRSVVGYMSDYPLPLRVQYNGSVFRTTLSKGVRSDSVQIGVEIFGNDSFHADTEILLLADKALKAIKLKDYKIIIGDKEFLSYIINSIPTKQDKIKNLISTKSTYLLEDELKDVDIDSKMKELIISVTSLFGGIEIFDKLKELSTFDKFLSKRVDYLKKVADNLISLGVDVDTLVFDISEIKGLDYYTGISFELTHPLSGHLLGSGGRYNNLMSKFGKDINAAGFALHLDKLMKFDTIFDYSDSYDYLIVGEKNFKKYIELQSKGSRVIFINDKTSLPEFVSTYKFKEIIEN